MNAENYVFISIGVRLFIENAERTALGGRNNWFLLTTTVYKGGCTIKGQDWLKNKLFRLYLSYSDLDSHCKYKVNKALTLGSMSTLLAMITKVHIVKRVI